MPHVTDYHAAAAAEHKAKADTTILVWTHPDYEDMTGTLAELGPIHAEYGGTLRPLAPAAPVVTTTDEVVEAFDMGALVDAGLVVVQGTGDITPPVQPAIPPDPEPALRTVDAGTVSAVAQERIQANNEILARIGLDDKTCRTLRSGGLAPAGYSYTTGQTTAGYTPGTTVIDLGYSNLATSRRRWEDQPPTVTGLRAVQEAIAAEDRKDYHVAPADMDWHDDGTVTFPGSSGPVLMEATALDTFLPRAKGATAWDTAGAALFPSAKAYLLSMPADERAWNMRRTCKRADPAPLLLRTRMGPTGRAVFASLTESYAAFDADKVAGVLARCIPDDMRGEVSYNGANTTLTVDGIVHAPGNMTDLAAGDVFKMGYRFRSNDSGGGSIRGDSQAWFNHCLNLIVIHTESARIIRAVHKGNVARVREEIERGIRATRPVFEQFARQWGCLRSTDLDGVTLWGRKFVSVDDALTFAVEEGKLDLPGAKAANLEYLLTAHKAEAGDDTLASIIAAITRAAHEQLVDDCARDTWEREAGALVPVLVRAAQQAG